MAPSNPSLEALLGIDIVDAIRMCFIFAACTTLVFHSLPALNTRFVNYGPRAAVASPPAQGKTASFLDYLATWRVPHRYFAHYYIVAVLSSAFWASQLLTNGPAFRLFVENTSDGHLHKSMTVHRVLLCSGLMAIQAGRRLYESMVYTKPSSSTMGVVHWLLGLFFYLGITVAVWIEGSGAIASKTLTLDDFRITVAPSLKTIVCLPVFLMASGMQHDCHHYLASLKEYIVPAHPLFFKIVSPHYTAECVIYLTLTILAAPEGELLNKTVLCGLFFVVANLGVTARNSRLWYQTKFGEDSVRGKWTILPGLY